MISNCLFNFINFCVIVSFLTRLLTSAILFSTALRAVVVAKLVILGILTLTSFILALRVVLVPKLVISDILSSTFLILALLFTTVLSLLKSTGVVSNFTTSNLSILLFKLLKLIGTLLIYQYLIYQLQFLN